MPHAAARGGKEEKDIYIYIYFNFNFNFNYSILTNKGYVTVSIFVHTAIYLLRATIPISGGHTKLPSVSFPPHNQPLNLPRYPAPLGEKVPRVQMNEHLLNPQQQTGFGPRPRNDIPDVLLYSQSNANPSTGP